MAQANVTWGAPRIGNELAKLGIEVAVSTVAKYMPRRRKPPSQTWRAFLETRCHLSLAGDAPEPRGVQGPELGEVVEFPEVGGLHHRYERAAA
jgi:hypothetical protein